MANGPNDFRDPKVTSTSPSGGVGKWIGIAIGVLLLLLILGWLLGWFAGDTGETPESVDTIEGSTSAPVDGAVDAPAGTEAPAVQN